MNAPTFTFRAKVWLYPAESAAWHFVTLPKKLAKQLRILFGDMAGGWGSLPVRVTIGETSWKTSIFPEKKSASYVLPLKAMVRKKEGIEIGNTISCEIEVRV